jgi:nucleotide-binding universal stress UspA family protein
VSGGFSFLVVADESPEFNAALIFAALRAKAIGGGLKVLIVIEPVEAAGWASVDAHIRAEAFEEAQQLAEQCVVDVQREAGLTPEAIFREGEVRAEIKRVLEEDPSIHFVVLAAGTGVGGPGPLVSSIAKGMGPWARVPVVIVPGHLSLEELRALAAPGEIPEPVSG